MEIISGFFFFLLKRRRKTKFIISFRRMIRTYFYEELKFAQEYGFPDLSTPSEHKDHRTNETPDHHLVRLRKLYFLFFPSFIFFSTFFHFFIVYLRFIFQMSISLLNTLTLSSATWPLFLHAFRCLVTSCGESSAGPFLKTRKL